MTAEKYDETMPTIEASGQFPPDGLDYHVAFTAGGSFRVSEIWDSMEQFEAFGQRLMPILPKAASSSPVRRRSSRSTTSSSGRRQMPAISCARAMSRSVARASPGSTGGGAPSRIVAATPV